jgi:hypothetical protein
MMEDVSEDEWHNGPPPAVRVPNEPLPAPRAPAPEPIDPEVVRQFQQFQQFQELIRQGDVLPIPPAARKPLWRKVLGSKAVQRLAVLLIVIIGLYWAYQHFFGSNDEQLPASMTGGHSYENTTILAQSPHEAVRKVYQRVADDSPDFVCGQFNESAKRQFANDFDFAAGTCEEAVHQLNARIDKSHPYKNTWADDQGLPLTINGIDLKNPPPDMSSIEISSCDVTVSPKLGWFKVERIARDQWIITQHRRESC